jgi:O-antigen/teichoic acid export membrane protein
MCADYSRTLPASSYLGNVGWNLGSAVLARAIEPVFLVLLARFLEPAAFGAYAIVVAVRVLYGVVKDLGLSAAVVVDLRQDDHRDLQIGVQLATATLGSLLVLGGSGLLASWLNQPRLVEFMPWLCVSFFLSALEDPLVTHLRKRNAYRLLFWRGAVPAVGFGVTSVSLAMVGHDVMALIWGHIVGQTLNVVYLARNTGNWPRPTLDAQRLKRLWQLGGHVTAQSIAGYLVMQADALIAGRMLGTGALGLYRMAQQLAYNLPALLLGQVREVLFTDAAAGADRPGYLQRRYDGFLRLFPLSALYFAGVYATAPTIVPWLMGEQWQGLVAPLQLMGLILASSHLALPNNDLGRILGIAAHYTVFSVLRSAATLIAVGVGASHSMEALVVAWVGVTLLSNYANCVLFQLCQRQVRVPASVHLVFVALAICFVVLAKPMLENVQ